jgi:hypothetical protein
MSRGLLTDRRSSNYLGVRKHWLVADAELHNTGNIGIVVRVTATWKQAGSRPIRMAKKAKVGINQGCPLQTAGLT